MTRDEWMAQIEANPGDWQMALIAADEIEQAGDELFAEQLRFAVQFNAECNTSSSVDYPIKRDLELLLSQHFQGRADGTNRAAERKWCRCNSVRFIPAFPRSLDEVYAGRELV